MGMKLVCMGYLCDFHPLLLPCYVTKRSHKLFPCTHDLDNCNKSQRRKTCWTIASSLLPFLRQCVQYCSSNDYALWRRLQLQHDIRLLLVLTSHQGNRSGP